MQAIENSRIFIRPHPKVQHCHCAAFIRWFVKSEDDFGPKMHRLGTRYVRLDPDKVKAVLESNLELTSWTAYGLSPASMM
jgi:hypothetical protein